MAIQPYGQGQLDRRSIGLKMSIRYTYVLIIFSGCALLGLLSCRDHQKQEKVHTDEEKEAADLNLRFDSEKITLIAYVQRINRDTADLVLRAYLTRATSFNTMLDSTGKVSEEAIEWVSNKYKISRHKVAALLLMYKYDVVPPEEFSGESPAFAEDDRY